jgi:hypothetical protein
VFFRNECTERIFAQRCIAGRVVNNGRCYRPVHAGQAIGIGLRRLLIHLHQCVIELYVTLNLRVVAIAGGVVDEPLKVGHAIRARAVVYECGNAATALLDYLVRHLNEDRHLQGRCRFDCNNFNGVDLRACFKNVETKFKRVVGA